MSSYEEALSKGKSNFLSHTKAIRTGDRSMNYVASQRQDEQYPTPSNSRTLFPTLRIIDWKLASSNQSGNSPSKYENKFLDRKNVVHLLL